MTLFGVSGCMALLLVGLGIRDSVSSMTEHQYGDIFNYTEIVSVDSSLTRAKEQELDLIVLMHDNVYSNEALGEILDYLVAEDYYFDTIDNCPEYTFVEN